MSLFTYFISSNIRPFYVTVLGDPEAVRGNDERWLGGESWNRSVSHAVLVFDAGLDERHLRELLLARVVPRYPRLACRLARLTPASSHHVWLPATPLHIERHVFRATTRVQQQQQQSCTEGELQKYVEHLLAQGLPTDKPLWEVHVLPKYGRHGDTAVVLRVHQSVADGMALVRVLCHALADSRVLHVPQVRLTFFLDKIYFIFLIT
jgi:diacylglycerol O-acyltransferase